MKWLKRGLVLKHSLYFLRRLHGRMHDFIVQKRKEILYAQHLHAHMDDTVYVLGSPLYTNLGDSAIFLAQLSFLRTCETAPHIHEITFSEYYQFRKAIKKEINDSCLLVGMGGGNMGNQWPVEEQFRYDMIDDFPNNPMIIFPQTLFFTAFGDSSYTVQKSQEKYNNKAKLTLVAREMKSYETMRRFYSPANVLIAPDIVLSASIETFGAVNQARSGVLMCLRNDPEKTVADDAWTHLEQYLDENNLSHRRIDMYSDEAVTKYNRKECVRKKMQEFCSARLVITDRLHGMVFAALTGTPCIVFSNYNHKVKGTYDWISYLPYIRYAETIEEAEKYVPELLAMKNCAFDNTPLLPYFEKLKEVVIEACQ